MATTISSGRGNSPKLTANIADHGTIYGGRGLDFDGVTDYFTIDKLNIGTTSGTRGMTIVSGNNNTGNLFFGDDGDNDIGGVVYNHNGDTLNFRANGLTRATVTGTAFYVDDGTLIDLAC